MEYVYKNTKYIVYPDGEKVTYGYDAGGQVVSIIGEHFGKTFKYVTNILYDEYGQRTRIDYGNGTFTEYSYDKARRWLDTIKTQNKWGKTYQNIAYSFDKVGNVLGYENDCLSGSNGNYKTAQNYEYDSLYQLTKVAGETVYNPYASTVPEFKSNYSQNFSFDSDGLGNMTSKVSTENVTPEKSIGDNLNYSFNYVYDENYAHRLVRAGERYYKYDSNGNVICEQDGSFDLNGDDSATYHKVVREKDDVYSTDYGWGLFKEDDEESESGTKIAKTYRRTYTWNERNQLVSSVDANYSTSYIYGQDGERTNKYTSQSETLYFNKMWTLHTDSGNAIYGGQSAKNIYLGETRVVTKLNSGENPTYSEEYNKQYFYHSDHLGSASLISDSNGDEYQRIEYTPYGETWVEKTQNTGLEFLPYKFTAKEQDEETGLYYYGARYLDCRYSRWISTDPALGDYMSGTEAGCGGIYNSTNLSLYHYAGNNPIKYTDPDGNFVGAVIGAAVGAIVSGGCEVFNQIVIQGKSLDNIDMRKVAIAASGGVISGAIAGTGIGLVGQIAINATISAAQNAGNQAIDISDGKQEDFDFDSFAVDTTFGAISGYVGGSGSGSNKVIDNAVGQLKNKVSKEINHKGLIDSLSSDTTKKALNYCYKNTRSTIANVTDVGDSVILTTAQNTLTAVDDYIEKIKNGDCNE